MSHFCHVAHANVVTVHLMFTKQVKSGTIVVQLCCFTVNTVSNVNIYLIIYITYTLSNKLAVGNILR